MSFKKLVFTAIIISLMVSVALPALAIETGLGQTAKEAGLNTGLAAKEPAEIIGYIIGIFLGFLGVIFVVLMVYGGYLWMTSYGNSQKVDKAKDLIVNAVLGLVVVIAAYAITSFVIKSLLGD